MSTRTSTLAPFDAEEAARFWCSQVLSSAAPKHVHNNCIGYFRKAIRAAYEAGRTSAAPPPAEGERERLARWCEAHARSCSPPINLVDIEVREHLTAIAALLRQPRERAAEGWRPIWLRRVGEHVEVLVETPPPDKRWVTVIREFLDSPFSHITEPAGIERRVAASPSIEEKGHG